MDTLLEAMEQHARARPQAALIQTADAQISWGEFARQTALVAGQLVSKGARRVGFFGDLSPIGVAAFWSVLRAGASIVPLPSTQTADVLQMMAADSKVELVVATRAHAARAAEVFGGAPPDAELAVLDRRVGVWSPLTTVGDTTGELPRVLAAQEFNVIYSSGTTSTPKGVVHSHGARLARTNSYAQRGFSDTSAVLVSTPIYSNWSVVAMATCMRFGARMLLLEKFDAAQFLDLAREGKATHAFMVPTQIVRCLSLADFDARMGGQPLTKFCSGSHLRTDAKQECVERWAGTLYDLYGLTEGAVNTVLDVAAFPEKRDSVGKPGPGFEVLILDANGAPAPVGEAGEIAGRSGAMMEGYLNREEETERITWRDPEGRRFLRTGDLGRLDEDGFLYLAGRAKDMIISGGMNIYAKDLEEALHKQPGVIESAVVAAPDADWGETPVAFVVAHGDIDVEALRVQVNRTLARTHRIARIHLIDQLPRGTLDKVAKAELRQRLAAIEASG
ncbi:MAG TPA: class I adenylate-forming enzyme family protein [Caulobacterales bacterium]|nr:class I adenylate-forming enzyme family protein [Caulobacterales bacterium]